MNLENENENSLSIPLLITALVLSLFFAVGSSMPSVRKIFTSTSEERKILAKIFAEYNDKTYVIFKIKTQSGIDLEIYQKDPLKNEQHFKQKFSLNDDADAYLMVNSDTVNLGLVDINHDHQLDVICPTVDKGGNSRLNVFQFNNQLEQFVPVTEGE